MDDLENLGLGVIKISNSYYRKVQKFEPKRRNGIKYLTINGVLHSKIPPVREMLRNLKSKKLIPKKNK